MATRRNVFLALTILIALVVSACNLAGAPSEEQIAQTATAAVTDQPTWTPVSSNGVPTTVPVNQPTSLPTFQFPTAIVVVPTRIFIPTSAPPVTFPPNTPLPVSIAILSPVPGNIVAGNVQMLGSAIHPQFLQYQVEFGPDPNPNNLWFPATSAVPTPILNGLLGIWNTTTVQDGRYQLRLRVYLRDGTLLTTVINNITVQNRVNTPVPSPTQNIPRPIAAFTQDKASGDVPLTVQFVNQSSGTISVVSWSFGDGNSSADVNPKHTFGTPGLYNVTLTVAGPGGTSNVARQINVTSPTAPVAGFTQDRTSGVAPLPVKFTDQSSGNVTSYNWNFSDGSSSAERNPSHTFTTPGTYNVFLTVSGPGGSSSVTRQIVVSSTNPPTATATNTLTFTPTFTATGTATNTTTVLPPTETFTPTATSSSTDTPTATDTATNTTTVLPPTETFTPTATSSSTDTPTATDTATDTTTPVPSTETPTATFTATDTETPTATNTFEPLQVAINAQVSGTNVTFSAQANFQIANYLWDFGDGTQQSTEPTPTHSYQGGSYTVTLQGTDVNGRNFAVNQLIGIVQPNFTFQPNGLGVDFTDTSTGQVTSQTWDFGDGTSATGSPVHHDYAGDGTYAVTVTVTDGTGQPFTSQPQSVTVNQPVQPNFTFQPNGLGVDFTDTSTGQVTSQTWDFGDGTSATGSPVHHDYAGDGTYAVTVTVTDGTGQPFTSQPQSVTVSQPVQPNFTFQPNGLGVDFTDTSTGQVTSQTWDFGDGTSATGSPVHHDYAGDGTYAVTVTVTDGTGQPFTSQPQSVTVSQPVQPNFTFQPNGLGVDFTDTSTGQVTSQTWDFGDGTSATGSPVHHDYAADGTYTITLTVTDGSGQPFTSQPQSVTVSQPVQPNFTFQSNGLGVDFTDTSTGQVTSQTWDFGDGTSATGSPVHHDYAGDGTYAVTVTVTDGTGQPFTSQPQSVTVSQPVQPNFTFQSNGLGVDFTDTSTGQVTSQTWDFGDGTSATGSPVHHDYAADGTYTVTLTVTDGSGQPFTSQPQSVTVSQPVQPNFTFLATDLGVDFTDTTVGAQGAPQIWDFGDGNTGTGSPVHHDYSTDGTYTVTLTITDTNGRTFPTQQDVTVAGSQPKQTLVDTTPIRPDFNILHDILRGIYANGVNNFGNQASVFAQAGDNIFTQPGLLDPFATQGQYNLDTNGRSTTYHRFLQCHRSRRRNQL